MKKNMVCLSVLSLAILTSCSVVMAAKKEGMSVTQVQTLRTRGQLIASGAHLISSDRLPTGQLCEVYQIQNKKGSAARAFMHGLLDVSTCGLWEVIGTPIEACGDAREYYCVRITFDEDECIRRVELL
jgi:hypothetical protein